MRTATVSTQPGPQRDGVSERQWMMTWRRFRRHRLAVTALTILMTMLLLSAFAPLIAPFPRDEPSLQTRFVPPLTVDSQENLRLLGTDHLGRDLFTRILYASRVSLFTALNAALFAALIGIIVGLISGYFGGIIGDLLMRLVELIAVFPTFLLLAILSFLLVRNDYLIPLPAWVLELVGAILGITPRESRGVLLFILLLSLLGWTTTARLARGMALGLREQAYIDATRALGGGHQRMILRHILPNALPVLIVDFTLLVNLMLVTESALSFLSFGIQDPTPTWGSMLAVAQSYMFQHPWMPIVPALPILLTALAINYVGDGLRDALDPRQQRVR